MTLENALGSHFREHCEAFVDRLRAPHEVQEALSDFLLRPGKRLRPRFFLRAYEAMSGNDGSSSGALDIACALETFHLFSLIHDDIIDDSMERRGGKALHRSLADGAGDHLKFGSDMALILGDMLFSSVCQTFLRSGFPLDQAGRALDYFLDVSWETGRGELLELINTRRSYSQVSVDVIEDVYRLKTTLYTFECPLVVAALLTGQDNLIEGLQKWSVPVGLAFQLENDLAEWRQWFGQETAESPDLQTGVKTMLMTDEALHCEWECFKDQPYGESRFRAHLRENPGLWTGPVETVRWRIGQLMKEADDLLEQEPLCSPGIGPFLKELVNELKKLLAPSRQASV